MKNKHIVYMDTKVVVGVGNGACVYIPKKYLGKKAVITIVGGKP